MKGFCPLASGSKGNSIYLGTGSTKILIDAGIGIYTLKKRLSEIDVDISEIDAVIISHEHSDHVCGLESLGKAGIPIFCNSGTAKALSMLFKEKLPYKIFATGETFEYGDLQVHPFSVQHDTLDPVAFTIHAANHKIGICTDLGFATTLVKNHLKQCDILYVESNHEPSMVHACSRPMIYKQRVLGRQGHLSNDACSELLKEVSHDGLKQVYLAHLSEECNSPELALEKARGNLPGEGVALTVALQRSVSQSFSFSYKDRASFHRGMTSPS